VLIDVRTEEDFQADRRLIPGSLRRPYDQAATWAGQFTKQPVVIICQKGKKLSHGLAAYLRTQGTSAEVLENGIEAWVSAGLPLVPASQLP
jgi:rhodanese-related sulfurtransferase